jgi:hypothetical protein
MSNVIPIKAILSGTDVTALGELQPGDTIPVSYVEGAMKPGDDAATLGSSTAADGYVLTADGAGNSAWEALPAGGGGGLAAEDIDTLAELNAIVTDATLIDGATLADVALSGDYNDLINTPDGGSGDMLAETYDPGNVAADVYARAHHTGEQAISTVTGLQTALDDKIESTDIDTLAKLNAIVADATLVDVGADNDWAGQQTFTGGVKEAWTTLTGTTPALTQGNAVWALSGASTPIDGLVNGESLTLRVTGGDTHAVTWPGTWLGGSAPTLAGNDLIVMWKEGGVLYANYMGAF